MISRRRSSMLFALATSATLVLPALAHAAEAPPAAPPRESRPNAVQLDLGLAVVGLAYERVLSPRVALQLEAQVFGTWFGPAFDLPNLRGLGGQLRPSFFLTEDAPRGVYVAPFLRIDRVTATKDDLSGSAVGFSSGVFGGYSWLFAERVNLRLGAGVQYMAYDVPVGLERVRFRTLFPALDLVVGWVF